MALSYVYIHLSFTDIFHFMFTSVAKETFLPPSIGKGNKNSKIRNKLFVFSTVISNRAFFFYSHIEVTTDRTQRKQRKGMQHIAAEI